MQQRPPQRKPPPGVIFDADMRSIGDVLALALLFGLDGKEETRVVSLSVTNPDLSAAAYCDAVRRFYAAGGFFRGFPVGLAEDAAPAEAGPMLTAPLARRDSAGAPLYPHDIGKLTDTAEPHALIRNALTAQHDGNVSVLLAGPADNLLRALELPGVKELAARKVRVLTVAGCEADAPGMKRLFAEWPAPIVCVEDEVGAALPFPGASLETDFAWAANHPVLDAYRAHGSGDAAAPELAAALYTVRPNAGYFRLSEPAAGSKRRSLLVDPAQKERVTKAYRELVSAKPVPRRPRFRPQQQQQQAIKPEARQ